MKLFKTGQQTWENLHETFVHPIKDLYQVANDTQFNALDGYNNSTKELQKLIAESIQNNIQFRGLGAGWSWTKIAVADNGIMLDTKSLNTVFEISADSVVPEYTGDPGKLFLAQCGNGIWEISKFLRKKNLSLKTSGASNGQTIAGMIATGAHGSAFDFGAAQDFVVGLHIIVGPNRHVWLERKSAPVVSDVLINNLQTERIQDDALFNAALVSFGSFGIIHGVMIETEDLFLLEAYMRQMPYDDSLRKIMETLDFSNANLPCGNERPFHFAVSLNPYDKEKRAYVTTMYKRPYREDYQRPVNNPAGIGPGDDAAVFVGRLTDVVPTLVPGIVNGLLAGAMTPFEKQFGTIGEIFDNTTLHGKLLSAAIGIPIAHVNKVTDLMLTFNDTDGPFVGLFAYRFVKKSNATLAFTRFDQTCVFELDAAFSPKTLTFFTKVWKMLEEEQIPFTFHWGKMNELTPQRISQMYGADADAWKEARKTLLDAACIPVFTNATLQEWGLD
ncbi:MAG: FAD-binding protein [Bacteroidota bacterium]